jgi:hypothetical protein
MIFGLIQTMDLEPWIFLLSQKEVNFAPSCLVELMLPKYEVLDSPHDTNMACF